MFISSKNHGVLSIRSYSCKVVPEVVLSVHILIHFRSFVQDLVYSSSKVGHMTIVADNFRGQSMKSIRKISNFLHIALRVWTKNKNGTWNDKDTHDSWRPSNFILNHLINCTNICKRIQAKMKIILLQLLREWSTFKVYKQYQNCVCEGNCTKMWNILNIPLAFNEQIQASTFKNQIQFSDIWFREYVRWSMEKKWETCNAFN